MRIAGLTGITGCGKSSCAAIFAQLGVPVVDADELARQAALPGGRVLAALGAELGENILSPDGGLNRRALADLIFADERKRRVVESIMHPEIRRLFQRRCLELEHASPGAPYLLYVVPLLFEKEMQDGFFAVAAVTCHPEEIAIQRVMRRDGLSRPQVQARLAAQLPQDDKAARADFVIENSGTLEELREVVQRLHRQLIERLL